MSKNKVLSSIPGPELYLAGTCLSWCKRVFRIHVLGIPVPESKLFWGLWALLVI